MKMRTQTKMSIQRGVVRGVRWGVAGAIVAASAILTREIPAPTPLTNVQQVLHPPRTGEPVRNALPTADGAAAEAYFDFRPVRRARTMAMRVTAYSPDAQSCGEFADGRTATLHSVETNGGHLVAADIAVLPYGTILTIPGYAGGRLVPVLDCGGAIKGNRLDVLFPTHEEAMEWGVRELEVTVWEYADGLPVVSPRRLR